MDLNSALSKMPFDGFKIPKRSFTKVDFPDALFPLIAQRLNMSERTIKRHLQAQGTTFLQILAEVRFSQARKLLQQPQYTIQNVADLVGYEEATNFIRAFKKMFGETPSQYRKSYLSNADSSDITN